MKLADLKQRSPVQTLAFIGLLAVDFFSLNHFFRLMGSSWILWLLPTIFVFVKVWHWVQFFKEIRTIKRILHLFSWFILSLLSIYSFINLGLAITEVTVAQKSETQVKAAEAIDGAALVQIQSLTTERQNLTYSVTSAEQKKTKTGTWGDESKAIRTQLQDEIDKSNTRIKEIDNTLLQLSADKKQEAKDEKESQHWYDVKPIGAQALMSQLIPKDRVHAATILLFFIIAVAMELTLALTSLPKDLPVRAKWAPWWRKRTVQFSNSVAPEDDVHLEIQTEEGKWEEPTAPVEEPATEPTVEEVAEENSSLLSKYAERQMETVNLPPADSPKRVVYVGRPKLPRLMEYIDAVYPEDKKRLSSNESLVDKGFPMDESSYLRRYLLSLKFKGIPLIESARGGTWPHVTRSDMKRLVEFFDSLERADNEGEEDEVQTGDPDIRQR